MQLAFFIACGLLLVGFVLRAKFKLLQVLYVPASVIGGIIGLLMVSTLTMLRASLADDPQVAEWHLLLGWISDDVVSELKKWPGWLLAVVFAGLFLERPARSVQDSVRLAAREGVVVWIIVLGEITVGLLATLLVVQKLYPEVPGSFGQLIEAGFAGGHGTAAALGSVFEDLLDFPEGKDLAFLFATIGLIYGVVSGIFYVNVAVRRGWTRAGDVKIPLLTGMEARHDVQPVGLAKVRSEVIDPMVFQALLLALAFFAGLGLQSILSHTLPFTQRFPLFLYTLLGGLGVRQAMRALRIDDVIDPDCLRRVTGGAMEFLIIAAITALNLTAVAKYLIPISLLLIVGFIWTGFCLLFIARRLLPGGYWFELGILNYGMSTGTTAQGMMLLRIIDKDVTSGAAEDYALAAPLSAPFIGGGVITLVVLPWTLQNVHIGWVVLVLAVVLVGLYALGVALARSPRSP